MHSGQVTCGVAGHRVPRYCVLGETVLAATKLANTSIVSTPHSIFNA